MRRLARLLQILRVTRKYALLGLLVEGRLAWLWSTRKGRRMPRGERLRLALEELGPVFVKFGQTLSTRPDLLPDDVASELTKLQDQVPPFDGVQAQAEIEQAFGKPVSELFDEFETQALASASIAQVHAARLKPVSDTDPGAEVVVKVLRPGVENQIRRDLRLMYLMADLLPRVWSEGARLRPHEVVAEYDKIIMDELDLIREGANASQLRSNWLGSELIYHPRVYFDYSRPNVLVLERLRGIPIDDIQALAAAGVNFQVLAERGVEIFFKQVFRDNFFHADMHPGNIFVDVDNPERPRYVAMDFGIVGSLTPNDQRYLAENLLAFFNRDYRRVAELHLESGWVPHETRVDEFESAIRSVCEPIFEKPLKDISFGHFLVRLFQTARRFKMEVQPQLVLLQKTLLNIEGLGRQLYPDLDLWKTGKPIMEDWMRGRYDPRKTLDRMRDQIPALTETIPELAHTLLRHLQQGELPGDNRAIHATLVEMQADLQRERRAQRFTIAGAALIVTAALLWGAVGLVPEISLSFGVAGLWCWVTAWRGR